MITTDLEIIEDMAKTTNSKPKDGAACGRLKRLVSFLLRFFVVPIIAISIWCFWCFVANDVIVIGANSYRMLFGFIAGAFVHKIMQIMFDKINEYDES